MRNVRCIVQSGAHPEKSYFVCSPFQQRTNTSWGSARSQPAVSRRLFRCFGAHLLKSPWIVKFCSLILALRRNPRGHTTSVTIQSSSRQFLICHRRHHLRSRCRVSLVHSSFTFVIVSVIQGIKNPASIPVSRVGNSLIVLLPAYLGFIKLLSRTGP